MARITFTSLLLVFTSCIALAQVASVRPQVGINFPGLTKDLPQGELKGHSGFQFGFDLQFGSGTVYFQPGLNYETAKIDLKNAGSIRLGRINIPAMVGFRIMDPDVDVVGLRAFTGPNFAFSVSEKLDDAYSGLDKGAIHNFMFDLAFGAGVDYSIFFADIGYKLSFSKLFESAQNSNAKLNMLFINIGVRLGQ